MAVMTISRQVGSGGEEIGRAVAADLDYRLVDKGIIEAILTEYGFAEFEQIYESVPGFWDRFDATRRLMEGTLGRVMRSLARHGRVVLLGRGGFAALAGFTDVLNVRIQAPADLRARTMMNAEGLGIEESEDRVRRADRVTAGFVESFAGSRWDDANAFDIVIDTGRIAPEMAAAWLVEAVHALEADPGANPAEAAVPEDPVLFEYLAGVLEDL